jgi:hypothetical protein
MTLDSGHRVMCRARPVPDRAGNSVGERGDQWENSTLENTTLERFLGVLACWIEDPPRWYRNIHREVPSGGDRTFFARAPGAAVGEGRLRPRTWR